MAQAAQASPYGLTSKWGIWPVLVAWPVVSTAVAVSGYAMQTIDLKYRWWVGHVALQIVGRITAPLMKDVSASSGRSDVKPSLRRFFFQFVVGMQMASCSIGFFGGKKYYEKYGIDSYSKAVIAAMSVGQTYFRPNPNARKQAMYKLARSVGILGVGYAICKAIANGSIPTKYIKQNPVLYMEALGFLTSIGIIACNIPSNILYLICSGNDDIEVIEPYDFCFTSKSPRHFWKNWSRPFGEMLRYMVYEPLGGRDRQWLSVPALFAVNCVIHYNASVALVGDTRTSSWNKAFAVMGIGTSLYILSEQIFLDNGKNQKINDSEAALIGRRKDCDDVRNSMYWKIWSFGMFHVSIAPALYVLHDRCWNMNFETMCTTFLGDIQIDL